MIKGKVRAVRMFVHNRDDRRILCVIDGAGPRRRVVLRLQAEEKISAGMARAVAGERLGMPSVSSRKPD